MNEQKLPARVTSPGRVIERELEARNWTQKDLASIMDRPAQAVNEIVRGSKQITPETAIQLGDAFGTSPEFWLNLESNYRLWLSKQQNKDTSVEQRAKLYSLAPVPEMIRRGWISGNRTPSILASQLCDFFEVHDIDAIPVFTTAFRYPRSKDLNRISVAAWIQKVKRAVKDQAVRSYSKGVLVDALPDLLRLSVRDGGVRDVPGMLASLGVRFAVVRHLDRTYLDGASWIDEDGPVVAVTLRHDRIDAFWFTLMHEVAHVIHEHGQVVDPKLTESDAEDDESEFERVADRFASESLLPQVELDAFIRQRHTISDKAITQFALLQQRHPGIVVGRLQHLGAVPYSRMRSSLVKVGGSLVEWTHS